MAWNDEIVLGTVPLYGEDYVIRVSTFPATGQPALLLEDSQGYQSKASVALPGVKLGPGEILIKNWGADAESASALYKTGLFVDTGKTVASGFVKIPVWRLKLDRKNSARNNPAPEVKALRAQFRKDYDDDWWKSPEIKAEYKRQLAAIGKSPYDSSGPKKPRAPRKPKTQKPKAPAIPAALTSGALTSQLRQVIPMLNRHIQGTCDRYGGMGMKDRYGSYCKVPPTVSHFDVKRKYIYMIGSTGQQEFRVDPKSGEVWRLSASGSPWFVGTLSDILKRGKTIDEHWAENNPKWRW